MLFSGYLTSSDHDLQKKDSRHENKGKENDTLLKNLTNIHPSFLLSNFTSSDPISASIFFPFSMLAFKILHNLPYFNLYLGNLLEGFVLLVEIVAKINSNIL